jgi:hypothetical protein
MVYQWVKMWVVGAGFSSMRRGLTSLVTSLDSALGRDDARSDAASTASSDSERYVLVGLAADSPDDHDLAFRYPASSSLSYPT